jgi:hypothetical protein
MSFENGLLCLVDQFKSLPSRQAPPFDICADQQGLVLPTATH